MAGFEIPVAELDQHPSSYRLSSRAPTMLWRVLRVRQGPATWVRAADAALVALSISDHCQHFGNCLSLAIPARCMDHCFALSHNPSRRWSGRPIDARALFSGFSSRQKPPCRGPAFPAFLLNPHRLVGLSRNCFLRIPCSGVPQPRKTFWIYLRSRRDA